MFKMFRNSLAERHVTAVQTRLAAIVGAVVLGLAAIVFARVGEIAQKLFRELVATVPYAPFIITPFVFGIVVYATRRWSPSARGSGIPQVMAAIHTPEHLPPTNLLSLKTAWAKFGGTLAMLFVGGSTGREGPTVQISAALMVAVHRWFRVPITSGVIIAGGAAGVAAAFNTPLAGVAFAIEELAAAFEQKVAVMVMATVMIAGLVSLGLSGDYVYFGAIDRSLPLNIMLIVAPIAGVLGGLLGGLFSRCLIAMSRAGPPWLNVLKARPATFAAVCGFIVALIGWQSNGLSWGTGYETTKLLLAGHSASIFFGPAKFVATLATAVSGAPGGIFAPSLSVGAGLGQIVSQLFPDSPAGAIVLLGMVGYFTGVVRAPMTSVIIMMEMTADRTMILPLFATALISDAISAVICREKLYHALSKQFAGTLEARTRRGDR